MVFGVALGIAISILIFGLFVAGASKYSQKFSSIDEEKLRELVLKLLIHGQNYETLNFDDVESDKFAQFKKYIGLDGDFAVDFVLPIVGGYKDKLVQVEEKCKDLKLHYKMVKTEGGWYFAFIEMSDGGLINDEAVSTAIELAELDFTKNVGVSANSTYRWRRKTEVFGDQKISRNDPSRYAIMAAK